MLPRTPDELGMYLRKIARTPLLDREQELATAEKVCQARRTFVTRLLANDYSLRVVLAAARKAAVHSLRIDHVVNVQGIDVAARQEAFEPSIGEWNCSSGRSARTAATCGLPEIGSNRRKGEGKPANRSGAAAVRPHVKSSGSSSRAPC